MLLVPPGGLGALGLPEASSRSLRPSHPGASAQSPLRYTHHVHCLKRDPSTLCQEKAAELAILAFSMSPVHALVPSQLHFAKLLASFPTRRERPG